jgi:1-deoxy-D-xylulose-5-phosphate synthase
MVRIAVSAAEQLTKNNIQVGVVNARFVKPLDTELLDKIANQYAHIITIEEGQRIGGFGSAICEYFMEKGYKNKIKIIGIKDHFIEHGNVNLLLEEAGLSEERLVEECIAIFFQKKIVFFNKNI